MAPEPDFELLCFYFLTQLDIFFNLRGKDSYDVMKHATLKPRFSPVQ